MFRERVGPSKGQAKKAGAAGAVSLMGGATGDGTSSCGAGCGGGGCGGGCGGG